jgi:excinuclease ABC subunit C
VFGLKVGPSGGVIQVFAMRGGRVVERVELATDPGGIAGGDADVLQAALEQFYELRTAPSEIHLPAEVEDSEAMEAWLSARAGRRVKLVVPQRGDKRALVELATRNAELSYRTRFNEIIAAHFEALETLRSVLGLPSIPRRIDCFDISTIQGSETVAAMVVCEDGRMRKSEYRKFRIRGSRAEFGADDFAAMREVVQRRYRKVLEEGGPFPDLILIDGGKGQLTAAYDALEQIGLANLVAVGIAKKEELLFTRDRLDPIGLGEQDPALLLLQRIRDEAHRFAVTFHRRARTMRDLRSELDAVPGIGPRRRRALLKAFGSLAGVRRATREELDSIVGAKAAAAVIDYFARS